jgi:glycerophosphoryl diester phosphodiesterase
VPALLSAHRGGPEDLLPPNSIEAIEAACALGVDFIEFDVRVTRDEKFVVFHDQRMLLDGQRRAVSSLSAAEFFRSQPNGLALSDVLDVIKGRARAHVDLKQPRREVEIADQCVAALGPDGLVLTTKEDLSVRLLRTARPELRVALSLGSTIGLRRHQAAVIKLTEVFPQARVRRTGANALAVNYQIARLGVLAWAHRHGIPVLLWTLNTAELIRRAQRDERVWAYTTDYPRLALRLAADNG